MTRDQLAALARGTVAAIAGAGILYMIGRHLGWIWVAGTALGCLSAAALDAWRRPGWWRMW